jgi:fluoroquinolone transport system permease protein
MPLMELIGPTMRTIPWGALAGSAIPAAFVVWHFQNQPNAGAGSTSFGLRVAAVTLALGLAFVLDDPTEDATAPAPVSVLARRALRVGLTLPPALIGWTILLVFGRAGLSDGEIPAWPFLFETVSLISVAFAGAAAGSRLLSDRLGGPAGAGTVVLVALTAAIFPWGDGLLIRVPGTPGHEAGLPWWLAIAMASAYVWWRGSAMPSRALRLGFRRSRSPTRPARPEGRTLL